MKSFQCPAIFVVLVTACWAVIPMLSGCGAGGTSDPVDVTPTGPDLKAILQPIAESGVVGSAGVELQTIAESRPELKDEITALVAADGNPAQVQQKANALLGKL